MQQFGSTIYFVVQWLVEHGDASIETLVDGIKVFGVRDQGIQVGDSKPAIEKKWIVMRNSME